MKNSSSVCTFRLPPIQKKLLDVLTGTSEVSQSEITRRALNQQFLSIARGYSEHDEVVRERLKRLKSLDQEIAQKLQSGDKSNDLDVKLERRETLLKSIYSRMIDQLQDREESPDFSNQITAVT